MNWPVLEAETVTADGIGWQARVDHGVLVGGETVAEAYDRLYYLERACQVPLYAMWTGRSLKQVPEGVVAHTSRQYAQAPLYGGNSACEHRFAALRRLLDRRDPGYSG